MKRGILLVAFCSAAGFVCSYLFSPATQSVDLYDQLPADSAESELLFPPDAGDSGVPLMPEESSEPEIHKIAAIAPSANGVREEAKKDPHGTPPSLLRFANSLGTRMKLALKNEKTATELFTELSNCVRDGSGSFSHSARALCYSDAAELSERYMRLRHQWNVIREHLDEKTLARFESLYRITSPSSQTN